MADFDPDAYLAEVSEDEDTFDPDAYLSEMAGPEEAGLVGAALDKVAAAGGGLSEGATFGHTGEIGGAVGGLGEFIAQQAGMLDVTPEEAMASLSPEARARMERLGIEPEGVKAKRESLSDLYSQYRENIEGRLDDLRERNPNTFMAGEIAGGFAVPGMGVAKSLKKGADIGTKIVRGAQVGAGYGALYGAGTADEGLMERLEGATTGAGVGAIGGALLPAGMAATTGTYKLTKGIVDSALETGPMQKAITTFKRSRAGEKISGQLDKIENEIQQFTDSANRALNKFRKRKVKQREAGIDQAEIANIKADATKDLHDARAIVMALPDSPRKDYLLSMVDNKIMTTTQVADDVAYQLSRQKMKGRAEEAALKGNVAAKGQYPQAAAREAAKEQAALLTKRADLLYNQKMRNILEEIGTDPKQTDEIIAALKQGADPIDVGIPPVMVEQGLLPPLPPQYGTPKTTAMPEFGKKVTSMVDEMGEAAPIVKPVQQPQMSRVQEKVSPETGQEYFIVTDKATKKPKIFPVPEAPMKDIRVPKDKVEMGPQELKEFTEELKGFTPFGAPATREGGVAIELANRLEKLLPESYKRLTKEMSDIQSIQKTLTNLSKSDRIDNLGDYFMDLSNRIKQADTESAKRIVLNRALEEGMTHPQTGKRIAPLQELSPELATYLRRNINNLSEKYGLAAAIDDTIESTSMFTKALGTIQSYGLRSAEMAGVGARKLDKGIKNFVTADPLYFATLSEQMGKLAAKGAKGAGQALRIIEKILETTDRNAQQRLAYGLITQPYMRDLIREAEKDGQ